VPVGGRRTALKVREQLVVQLHLVGVEGPLRLEARLEQAFEQTTERTGWPARGCSLGWPGRVDRGGVGGKRRRLACRLGFRRPSRAGLPGGRERGGARCPFTSAGRAGSAPGLVPHAAQLLRNVVSLVTHACPS
jgi:hypothetical protein